jgi:hypothetical protein
MLEKYHAFTPMPDNKAELKTVLQAIWDDLPQEFINRAVLAFRKRLQACIRAGGGHFEHQLLLQKTIIKGPFQGHPIIQSESNCCTAKLG